MNELEAYRKIESLGNYLQTDMNVTTGTVEIGSKVGDKWQMVPGKGCPPVVKI